MEKEVKASWVRGPCIGRGAYGTVNLGVNISNVGVFAVKSVNLATASPSQAEALESEIRILKSLSSPFIVKYLGDDTTTPFRNLHMEDLPAGTAADLAREETDLEEAAIASYTWCIATALSYLHSRGIMHCDVKGKNVLLGSSPGSARLADFGSAAGISSSGAMSARGSPLWMAPEVVRGEHQGAEADVWSLGCTVIEMATGKPAWGAEAYSVYMIGFSDELPLFPARLSSLGIDFLDKCLRRDYTKRWSCDQLLQHPFLKMRSQKNIAAYSSPRCVLDCINTGFDDDNVEEEEELGDLGAEERIRELVSGTGANWESDGWVVVRGPPGGGEGTSSEYFDLSEDRFGVGANSEYSATTGWTNLNLNHTNLPEERNYSSVNDVVAQQYNVPGHFYSNNNVYNRYSQEKTFYECGDSSYISDLYVFRSFIYIFFFQFVNFISFFERVYIYCEI